MAALLTRRLCILVHNARISEAICVSSQFRCVSRSSVNMEQDDKKNDQKEKSLTLRNYFENATDKTRNTYLDMVSIFENRDIHRRNHVEFIYAALQNMESFGVHRDLEVYKALLNVMPKGKFIPQNIFQAEFMHYPKQQQCIIDLLEQMEDNGVMPDYEMEDMLVNVFGRRGHPVRKYWRMMYWMPKFKNLSPWLLPNPVPDGTLELAKLAVERMCTVDLQSNVIVYQSEDVKDAIDQTWIVSGMSPVQAELLRTHDKQKPLYIEGPFFIWLRNKSVNYFTLRGDPEIKKETTDEDEDPDDVSNLRVSFFGRPIKSNAITKPRTIHEQDDGTIFAICATGTSTKDSLLSWVRCLEKDGNPDLENIPILFKFRSNIDSKLVPIVKDIR